MLALDMDGTLLNEEKEISGENRRWIGEASRAGIAVMFSTGRGRQSALPYAEQLGLETPMVLVNGSEVWRTPNELYKRTLMPLDWIRTMRKMALDYDVWYWAYAVQGIFNRENWPKTPEAEEAMGWLKFGYYSENPVKLPAIRKTLEGWGTLEITNSHPFNIELNPLGISKASGLRDVCEFLGLEMSQVIAMGDSENDLSMIREAGLGVAMGNAQDEVKAEADAVTATNDEDGVARVIRRYIFGLE
ncbi:Cof-type HAD-IIB family hydrolase [Gorillibacterium sp. sgz5001074]|uniref:Cof-type HAD-IIB family hydrolase n=1 Tax=Gorillibacterium sp. sgz5001074 TaxID=3446695 RepID=UPI003F672585